MNNSKENLILHTLYLLSTGRYTSVSLFLNKRMAVKDIVSALALKHFLEENGIAANIIGSGESAEQYKVPVRYRKEIEEWPSTPSFISILLSCRNEDDISSRAYSRSFEVYSYSVNPKSASKFGIKRSLGRGACVSELLVPDCLEVRDMFPDRYKFSSKVAGEFYLAMLYGTDGHRRNLYTSSLDTFRLLLENGADYRSANALFSEAPAVTLKIVPAIVEHMSIEDGLAAAVIPSSDMPEGWTEEGVDAAVKAHRNTDRIRVWLVSVEQKDGCYYTVLQTRDDCSCDLAKAVSGNNGPEEDSFCRCIVHEKDIGKLKKDLKGLIHC